MVAEMEQIKPINVARHWELTCPYADPALTRRTSATACARLDFPTTSAKGQNFP